jgi:hypothetical protein
MGNVEKGWAFGPRALVSLLVACVSACDRPPAPSVQKPDTTTVQEAFVQPPPPPDSLVLLPARFDSSHHYDLTGDSIAETISLKGSGPAWDSMVVVLEIRSGDTLLYADTFDTMRYTGLDPDPAASREQIAREVNAHLTSTVSDEAIGPTSTWLDEDNIDLRSATDLTGEEYVRFERDLMSRPMFRYYVGGETSTGITWSTVLRRFVETFVCC